MTAYRAPSQTHEDSFAAVSWEIQVKQHDIGARDYPCVDLVDVIKHLLAVALAGKRRVDVVVFERLLDQVNVRGVVLCENNVQLAAMSLTS